MGDADPCGWVQPVQRYQSATRRQSVTVRQRSQSATPLRTPGGRSYSRPTTPTSIQSSQLTEELRSLSETHLNDHVEVTIRGSNDAISGGRSSRPRSTHWSRRTPEDLARLARLRNSSRSPVSIRDAVTASAVATPAPGSSASSTTTWGSRPGSRSGALLSADRNRSVGTGYGHSYSLPRAFDTTPTGAERAQPHQGGKFERSRTPSQSGASYYRSRTTTSRSFGATAGGGCSCCGSGSRHQQQHTSQRLASRTMSETSLAHFDDEEVVVEVVEMPPSTTQQQQQQQQQYRYVSECQLEPRCVPTGYSSTVLTRKDSTWRRFVETVRFQKCLVPVRLPDPMSPTTRAPPPPPPRRYRTELEVCVHRPRPEGRPPIVHHVQAAA